MGEPVPTHTCPVMVYFRKAGTSCAVCLHGTVCCVGGLLDYEAVNSMLDSDQIGALGLDVQWQEPWDPYHFITKHDKYGTACLPVMGVLQHKAPACMHL